MNFELFNSSYINEMIHLFTEVFSDAEGPAEGKAIGELVSNLISDTDDKDLIGCIAVQGSKLSGGIFFSRFTLPNDKIAFILSPVAVDTQFQGLGIGQQLIEYGLNYLKSKNVELVLTYGDPDYYVKTGFQQIAESVIQAPHRLSQPIGWLAQSLDGDPIKAIHGRTQCVSALSDQQYW